MTVEQTERGRGFTSAERHVTDEEYIRLVTVGVDIGSSTSHLIFSRLILQLKDQRYVTVGRKILNESEILLTPYIDETTIDGDALGRFIDKQYEIAGLQREDVDTGALILTGVALLRDNARAIANLFAEEAGKFVSVSAGDNLEAILAAYGSGAMAITQEHRDQSIMNIDVGGGTTKITICYQGKPQSVAAIDVGARLIATDANGVVVRLEDAGKRHAKAVGLDLEVGSKVSKEDLQRVAAYMADLLLEHVSLQSLSSAGRELLRTPELSYGRKIDGYTFSGGVSEFIYGREPKDFGDMGAILGWEIRQRVEKLGAPIIEPEAGIRATVIGASQYTVQVSGSTIFIDPMDIVPIRNIPVINPQIDLSQDVLDPAAISKAVTDTLDRFDLARSETTVAIALSWKGSATYDRLDAVASGVLAGLKNSVDRGNPVVLVCDDDIGGLVGIHLKEERNVPNPVISIDRIELKDFDFIDIGALIPSTGAVPVIIKSLVFPQGQ
jgi:ethanolamine utilization protein EutA